MCFCNPVLVDYTCVSARRPCAGLVLPCPEGTPLYSFLSLNAHSSPSFPSNHPCLFTSSSLSTFLSLILYYLTPYFSILFFFSLYLLLCFSSFHFTSFQSLPPSYCTLFFTSFSLFSSPLSFMSALLSLGHVWLRILA